MGIEVENLQIGFGKNTLVESINMALNKGEIALVLSANGAGKSTLLKSLSGLIPFLSGSISIDGKSISNCSSIDWSKKISFHLNSIIPTKLTVEEILKFSSVHDHVGLDSILNELGIIHLKTKYIDEISDGQRQLVMLARCLAQDTPIIYLDEPTAFLDFINSKIVMNAVLKITAEGKIFIVNTHDRIWMDAQPNKIFGIKNKQWLDKLEDKNWEKIMEEIYF